MIQFKIRALNRHRNCLLFRWFKLWFIIGTAGPLHHKNIKRSCCALDAEFRTNTFRSGIAPPSRSQPHSSRETGGLEHLPATAAELCCSVAGCNVRINTRMLCLLLLRSSRVCKKSMMLSLMAHSVNVCASERQTIEPTTMMTTTICSKYLLEMVFRELPH